jgi:predicted nucleic acid-binding protein
VILVDTNVLLDLVLNDLQWAEWSETQLQLAQQHDQLVINFVGYAELVPAFRTMHALDDFLERAKINISQISREAAHLAGTAFLAYRKRQGAKSGVLADFFIGAHASVAGCKLLTRDQGRYRTYFPKVQLISPQPK